jgi:hypothetical protein
MDELSIIYSPDSLEIKELPPYEIQDYDIFDEKDFRKYINDIKKSVRGSLEYRQFIQYLRNNMNLNECSFFQNVNNMDTSKIKIEIHHSPYTLEDICMTVFNKRVFYSEPLDVEDVAKEVMYIHYFLMVGLIPLSETVHELVHNQYIFIPTDKVVGNYKEFENVYGHWIPEETKEKIKACEDRTLLYNMEIDRALLEQKQIPINLYDSTGMYQLPDMHTMENIMQKKIEEIRYQNCHSITDNSYDNIIDIDDEPQLIRGVTYDD